MYSQDIQVWQGDINGDENDNPVFWKILDPNEQQHALAISNINSRLNYVETHARLRMLLAGVVNCKPEQLRIIKAEHGKPYLTDYPELAFNLSHTANKCVIVYGYHQELGIDIESNKSRVTLPALVEKCFAGEEQEYWRQLPESEQIQSFYRFWTRKEAFVKAVGRGIALGLNRCVINPEDQRHFLRIPKEYGQTSDWQIKEVNVGLSYSAAYVSRPVNPHNLLR
jgi:4'-phosphopantetheinyl transferase